jgi:hypothetical protein
MVKGILLGCCRKRTGLSAFRWVFMVCPTTRKASSLPVPQQVVFYRDCNPVRGDGNSLNSIRVSIRFAAHLETHQSAFCRAPRAHKFQAVLFDLRRLFRRQVQEFKSLQPPQLVADTPRRRPARHRLQRHRVPLAPRPLTMADSPLCSYPYGSRAEFSMTLISEQVCAGLQRGRPGGSSTSSAEIRSLAAGCRSCPSIGCLVGNTVHVRCCAHSQIQVPPDSFDSLLRRLIHQNFIRPRPCKTLARPFPCRVHAHLRSIVLQPLCMVQRVHRPQ